MKTHFLVLAVTAVLLTGCGNKHSGKPASSTNSTADSTNKIGIATAPVDYLGTIVKAQKNMTKTIDVSYLNEALSQFNVQEGHYPKDLQELVPNYVAKLPTPPYGYKLDYDANSGTVKVVQQ
jgi:ABC-type enterochelin transport system substrate-binding protein